MVFLYQQRRKEKEIRNKKSFLENNNITLFLDITTMDFSFLVKMIGKKFK